MIARTVQQTELLASNYTPQQKHWSQGASEAEGFTSPRHLPVADHFEALPAAKPGANGPTVFQRRPTGGAADFVARQSVN